MARCACGRPGSDCSGCSPTPQPWFDTQRAGPRLPGAAPCGGAAAQLSPEIDQRGRSHARGTAAPHSKAGAARTARPPTFPAATMARTGRAWAAATTRAGPLCSAAAEQGAPGGPARRAPCSAAADPQTACLLSPHPLLALLLALRPACTAAIARSGARSPTRTRVRAVCQQPAICRPLGPRVTSTHGMQRLHRIPGSWRLIGGADQRVLEAELCWPACTHGARMSTRRASAVGECHLLHSHVSCRWAALSTSGPGGTGSIAVCVHRPNRSPRPPGARIPPGSGL